MEGTSNATLVSSHLQILENFWDKGLTGMKNDTQKALAAELSGTTGLSKTQIKNWIASQKKRQMSRIRRKIGKRKKSGRDLFFARSMPDLRHLSAPERFRKVADMWRKLTPAENESEQASAGLLTAECADPSTFSAEEKKLFVSGIFRQMEELMTKLERVGGMGLCLVSNSGELFKSATLAGDRFFNSSGIGLSWASFARDDNQQPSASSSKQAAETRLAKELSVKAAFNHKYRQSHGRLHVPYAKIERGQRIAVTGMPAGILFRNPSKMTVAELDRVLATMDGISFCAVSSEGTASVSTSGSTTCVSTSGSTTSVSASGSMTYVSASGSTTSASASGSTTSASASGSTTSASASGSTTSVSASGSTTCVSTSGSTTCVSTSGSTTCVSASGSTTSASASGSTTSASASGSTTSASASGSMTSSLDEQYLAFIARNRDLFNRPKM